MTDSKTQQEKRIQLQGDEFCQQPVSLEKDLSLRGDYSPPTPRFQPSETVSIDLATQYPDFSHTLSLSGSTGV
jgi:hypothetical protein